MSDPIFRRAIAADLPAIVALLADDVLGAQREKPGDPAYGTAFAAIGADPQQLLAVAEVDGQVVACLQLTFIPGLSHRGAWRGQIESVRVAASTRGSGLGRKLIGWAVDQCRARGCTMVQLTSTTSRTDAQRFYCSLGFEATHVGMKLTLEPG